MSAFPIAWHEECLVNFKASLAEKEKKAKALTEDIARMKIELAFRESQINRAKALKKTQYDAERFMKQ